MQMWASEDKVLLIYWQDQWGKAHVCTMAKRTVL